MHFDTTRANHSGKATINLLPAATLIAAIAASVTSLRADDAVGGWGNPLEVGQLSLKLPLQDGKTADQSVLATPTRQAIPLPATRLTLDASTTAAADAAPSEEKDEQAELAKKLQNPVANLISVPFQYNADFNIGPQQASRSTLNIQPVIPVPISKDWNLIIRTIVPVIYAASPADGISSEWGLGDTTQSFFLSPKEPVGGWILGAGPVVLWPTATNDLLGSGKWGAGPTAVALRQEHGWTYGILANQIWSFAGASDRRSVNATFLQPFIAYTFPTYTTISINTESTYNWAAHQWTIPINLAVAQLVKIGKMPVQFEIGGRYYADSPAGGPDWGLRFVITFLFPER
jgi:hypothetical protein